MKIKEMTRSAIMLALLIVCSQISIPVGPVPLTLQTLAVLMIGLLLTPKNALITTTLYALMGLAGLPVFSNFSGGIQSILQPSFGFVLAFIPASYLQAKYLEYVQSYETKYLALSCILNVVITYAIGLPYMSFILQFIMGNQMSGQTILMAGLIPFIPGDFLKLATAIFLGKRLLPILQNKTSIVQ